MKVYWNYNDYSQKAKATFYFFFSWWRFTCSSPPQWREESGWWRRHAEVQLKCDIQHIAPVAKCDYHNQRVSWQLPRPRSAERRTDWLTAWLAWWSMCDYSPDTRWDSRPRFPFIASILWINHWLIRIQSRCAVVLSSLEWEGGLVSLTWMDPVLIQALRIKFNLCDSRSRGIALICMYDLSRETMS